MRLCAFILSLALTCGAADYYVSPSGSDSADGSLATPFLTFEAARNAATIGDTVYVRGGTYLRTNTFALASTNSGVTYQKYTGETPVVVGGLLITNWQTYSGSIKVTDVSTQGVTTAFSQLIADNYRQTLARFPNYVGVGTNSYNLIVSGDNSKTNFYYATGNLPHTYTNINAGLQVNICASFAWNDIEDVTSIDTGNKILYHTTATYTNYQNARWFLQNALEELDAVGEWYLDGEQKYLYFWPSNANPVVYVPVVSNLVTIASGTTNVTWKGFTMQCCDGSAVVLTGTTNCLVAANIILNSGGYANSGIQVLGGYTNRVIGNDIGWSGKAGILAYGADSGTVLDNNYIHHFGEVNKNSLGSAMVLYLNDAGTSVSDLTVTRNTVTMGARSAVFFSGTGINMVSNYVYSVMLDTDDGGAFYTSGAYAQTGNLIARNYIDYVPGAGYSRANGTYHVPYESVGVYLDQPTYGMTVNSNIISRCYGSGITINYRSASNTVLNNVLYQNHPTLPTIYDTQEINMVGLISPTTNNVVAWNICYSTNAQNYSPSFTFRTPSTSNTINSNAYTGRYQTHKWFHDGSAYYSIQEWTATYGFEANSITNDPLLQADFSLDVSSPALAIGINSISTNGIGCYSDTLRATWPLGASTAPSAVTTTINGPATLGSGTIIR